MKGWLRCTLCLSMGKTKYGLRVHFLSEGRCFISPLPFPWRQCLDLEKKKNSQIKKRSLLQTQINLIKNDKIIFQLGGITQWQSVRFACGKPRVQIPVPPNNFKFFRKNISCKQITPFLYWLLGVYLKFKFSQTFKHSKLQEYLGLDEFNDNSIQISNNF